LILERLTKAKIGYFDMTIIHKNIIGFDVPMHDVVLREDLERLDHLPEVEESTLLGKGSFLLH
jgi:hypothetical protein